MQFCYFYKAVTDGRTDQPMDKPMEGWTKSDIPFLKDAIQYGHLKMILPFLHKHYGPTNGHILIEMG